MIKDLAEVFYYIESVWQSKGGTVFLIVQDEDGLYTAWTTNFKSVILVRSIKPKMNPTDVSDEISKSSEISLISLPGRNQRTVDIFASVQVKAKLTKFGDIVVSMTEGTDITTRWIKSGAWLVDEHTKNLFELLGRKVVEEPLGGTSIHRRLAS